MKPDLNMEMCTACHACVSVCPASCITMEKDSLGFLRPHVDETACLGCGLCEKTCKKVKEVPACPDRRVWAARHKEPDIVKKSASGGVFTALTDVVLEMGGAVVGAQYGEHMVVHHGVATNAEERNALRGSKYTYSLCDKKVFEQVQMLLEKGTPVLFSGTPCQVAALRVYLGKSYEHLYLVDILCHGIAAPVLYQDYVQFLEKKKGAVEYIDFRYAPDGNWHDPQTRVTYKNGKYGCKEIENSYFRMFVRNFCLRESCYTCNYACFDRVSDITLGDFWGIESSVPSFDAPDGVSVVVTSTEKGAKLFEQAAASGLIVAQCSEGDCSHHQLNGLQPGGRNQAFLGDYNMYGYEYVHKKYTTTPFFIRVREKLYRIEAIRKLRDKIKSLR